MPNAFWRRATASGRERAHYSSCCGGVRSRSSPGAVLSFASTRVPSGQPALAALVVLDVAKAGPAFAAVAAAEVEALHVGVAQQGFARAVDDDASVFHDVAVVGHAEGDAGVLL